MRAAFRWQHYRRVLESVLRNLIETVTVMTHALAGSWRRTLRDEEGVLDTAHNNPSASTRHISSATGLLSDRAACRENKLCPFQVRPVQGLLQGTDISVCSFLHECYTRLCTPLNIFWRVEAWRKSWCHGSSGVQGSNCIQTNATGFVPGQPSSSGAQFDVTCEACSGGGRTLRTASVIMHITFSVRLPTTRTGSTQKAVTRLNNIFVRHVLSVCHRNREMR
jgi:hypothetical protein